MCGGGTLILPAPVPLAACAAVNPYVASTLSELSSSGLQPPFIPRQDAAGIAGAAQVATSAAMGVSSFAFQGTNAHVTLASVQGSSACSGVAAAAALPAALWRRQRFWFTVEQHQMLACCVVPGGGGAVRMEGDLASARLAYLHDHQVSWRWIEGSTISTGAASLLGTPGQAGPPPIEEHVECLTEWLRCGPAAGAPPCPVPGSRHA